MSLSEVREGQAQSLLQKQETTEKPAARTRHQIAQQTGGYVPIQFKEDRPAPSPAEDLTKGELEARTAFNFVKSTHEFIQEHQHLHQERARIDPEQEYVMQTEGPSWSRGQILRGEQIQGLYNQDIRDYEQSYAARSRSQKDTIHFIRSMPEGTTFKERITTGGSEYIADVPETAQLEFSREKIRQIERLPPVIREVQLAQFYMGSNLASLGKGVADAIGYGRQYDILMAWEFAGGSTRDFGKLIKSQEYGTRYTSWGAYLPGGIKGETEILERHPVEATIGNIGAEAVQWVGITYATKPITKGASFLFSKAIQKAPVISERFTMEFLPYSGRFLNRIGETEIGKNIGLYARGYRPAWLIGEGTSKISQETFNIGERITAKTTEQELPYTLRLPASRKFLSPEKYAVASEELTRKLSKKSIDIGFPTLKQSGRESFLVGNVTQKSFQMKGFLRKYIVEYGTYSEFKSPGITMGSLNKKIMDLQEFEQFLLRHGAVDIEERYMPGNLGSYNPLPGDESFLDVISLHKGLPRDLQTSKLYSKGELSGRLDSVYSYPTRDEVLRHELTHKFYNIDFHEIYNPTRMELERVTQRLSGMTKKYYYSYEKDLMYPVNQKNIPLNLFGDTNEILTIEKGYGSMSRAGKTEYIYSRINKAGEPSIISRSSNIPALESEITTPFQKKYYAARQIWGKMPYGSEIEPKAFINKRIRQPNLVKNIQAEQRLVPQLEIHQKPIWNPKTMRTGGIMIPDEFLSIKVGSSFSTFGAKIGAMKWAHEQRSLQLPETRRITEPMSLRFHGELTRSSFKQFNKNITLNDTDFDRLRKSDIITRQIEEQFTEQFPEQRFDKMNQMINQNIRIPFIPMPSGIADVGIDIGGWDEFFGRKKRYRKTKTFDPLEELFGM